MWDQVGELMSKLSPEMREAIAKDRAQFIYDEEKRRVICVYKSAIPIMSRDVTDPLLTIDRPPLVVTDLNNVSPESRTTSLTCPSTSCTVARDNYFPGAVTGSELTPTPLQAHLMEYIENNFLSYKNCPNQVSSNALIPNYLEISMSRRSGKTELIKFMQAQNPDLNIGVVALNSIEAGELRQLGLKNVYSSWLLETNIRGCRHMDICFFDDLVKMPSPRIWEVFCDFAVRLYSVRSS